MYDIFKLARGSINKEEIYCIGDIENNYKDFLEWSSDIAKIYKEKKDIILKMAQKLDINLNQMYFLKNTFDPILILGKNGANIKFPMIDIRYLDFMDFKEHFKILEKKTFEDNIMFSDNNIKYLIFELNFNKIPNNKKFETFLKVYSSSDYLLNKIPKDFLNEIFYYNNISKEKIKKDIQKNNGKINNQGYITIYRGATQKSSSLENSLSWTISKENALFFRNRFIKDNCERYLYKAKVHYTNVMAYIDREKEVLVQYKDIIDLKIL